MTLEIKVAIVECPIFEGRAGEEGGSICEIGKSLEYQRVRRGGRFDVMSEREVQGIDNHWVRNDRGINII